MHRDRPFKRRWACMRDGDLWEHTQKIIAAKRPQSVKAQKVKGHASDEMVVEGRVRAQDKRGNDKADQVAGRGAKQEQSSLHALTGMYAKRHAEYKKFIARIQVFLVEMMKAEKRPEKQLQRRVSRWCKKGARK